MTQHTEGPWTISDRSATTILGPNGRVVATTGGFSSNQLTDGGEAENKANANLVASAPELLAACQGQNKAIDQLFVLLVEAKPGFFPSRRGAPWAAMRRGVAAIARAKGSPE